MNYRKTILAFMTAALMTGCAAKDVPAEPAAETPEPTAVSTPEPTPEVPEEWAEVLEVLDADVLAERREDLKEAKSINPDIVAWVYFPSGLVSQPVAQGGDNEFYLRHDWKTKAPLDWGSIYMDFRNDIGGDDQNTILYGNYVYTTYSSDRTLVFTPLAELRKEENYEPNKYVTLITEEEIRLYEIAHVFDVPTEYVEGGQIPARGFEFNYICFTPEELMTLINNIKGIEFYHTGVEIQPDDTLLMMQTCVENHTETRQIHVCRELTRIEIEDERL